MFFEVRKRMDLYLWMSKTPDGPSVKFHVANSAYTWGPNRGVEAAPGCFRLDSGVLGVLVCWHDCIME